MKIFIHLYMKTNKISKNRTEVMQNFEKITYIHSKFIITHTKLQEQLENQFMQKISNNMK